MMQADVERHFRNIGSFQKHGVAEFGMMADTLHLVVVERAGLVEDSVLHAHLADIVQQAGHAVIAHLALAASEMARHIDHQGADCDRVEIGVFVLLLQPENVEQRARSALDHLDDLVHQTGDLRHPNRAPQTDIAAGTAHRHQRFGNERLSAFAVALAPPGLDHWSTPRPLTCRTRPRRLRHDHDTRRRRDFRLWRRRPVGPNALFIIDNDGGDFCLVDLRDIRRLHDEAREPEGVIQPASTEFGDIHSRPDL